MAENKEVGVFFYSLLANIFQVFEFDASVRLNIKSWEIFNFCVRMPPGPAGIPLLGNILQISEETILEDLTKWRRKYGDIIRISFLGKDFVIVCICLNNICGIKDMYVLIESNVT